MTIITLLYSTIIVLFLYQVSTTTYLLYYTTMLLLFCSPEKNNPKTTADRMTIISQLMSRPQLLVVTHCCCTCSMFSVHCRFASQHDTTPEPELVALFLSEQPCHAVVIKAEKVFPSWNHWTLKSYKFRLASLTQHSGIPKPLLRLQCLPSYTHCYQI